MFSLDEWRRKLAFSATFACFTAIVLRASLFVGEESTLYDHKPGKCKTVISLGNVVAVKLNPVFPYIFTFGYNDDNQLTAHLTEIPKGSENLNGSLKVVTLTVLVNSLKNFNPISLDIHIEGAVNQKKHRTFIYVISKGIYSTNVEVFELLQSKEVITHLYTINHASFKGALDIVVLSPGRFILSIPTFFTFKWLNLLEVILLRGYGSLLLFNGKTTKTLENGLNGPSSLLWNEHERRLFVGLKYSREIKVYKLEKDFALSSLTVVSLMSTANSITLLGNDLWVGADPQVNRDDWFEREKPVHVLRVRFQDPELTSWVLTEPFSSTKKTWANLNGVFPFQHGVLLTSSKQSMFCTINEIDLV